MEAGKREPKQGAGHRFARAPRFPNPARLSRQLHLRSQAELVLFKSLDRKVLIVPKIHGGWDVAGNLEENAAAGRAGAAVA